MLENSWESENRMEISMKDLLISALKVSGKILLGYFDKPIITHQKESQSNIVTLADVESEKFIIQVIRERFFEHNILSEECGFINNNSAFTWVIDPLDGTSNFAAGIPWFGVLISIFHHNTPVMGGAYLPVQDLLYFAEKGQGSFRNGKPIPKLDDREIRDSLFAFSVDYTLDEDIMYKRMEIFKLIVGSSRNIRSTNSLVDFIYVLEGRFGGVLNLDTKVWDISALGLLISECGGNMKNTSGKDLYFSLDEDILHEIFPVITGSRKIVETIEKAIAQII
jgi:myo-inositol-1(or 4)-monophosphatase